MRYALLFLIPTLVVTASASSTNAATHFECGTPERLDEAFERMRDNPVRARVRPGGGGGEPKVTRDSFPDLFEVRESANFAVKWINSGVSEERAASVLKTLEESWTLYFDVLGHSLPAGADTFRFNLYVSGPNDNPSIDFAGGYATIDNEGFPFMVVSEELALGARLDHVVAHEFYHDVQFGAQAYNSFRWYWEATADWAGQELYPMNNDPFIFVGGYAMRPELSVFYYGDPFGSDPVEGAHQYGASVFPRFVSLYVGGPTTISQSWEMAGPNEDPLEVIDRLLPTESLIDHFGAFAARNALWDYPGHYQILAAINLYKSAFPASEPVMARHPANGTGGLVSVASERLPRSMGYNVVEGQAAPSGKVKVTVAGDATGSRGTPSTLAATVVSTVAGETVYTPIPITAGQGELELDIDYVSRFPFYLVVAAPSPSRDDIETFGYQYSIIPVAPEPEPEPEPEDPGGCGCASRGAGGGGGSMLLLFALGALAFRPRVRRRRRTRK